VVAEREATRRASVYVPSRHAGRVTRDMGVREAVSRDGTRLGMGGGWYDRALHHRRPGTPVWALANSDEVLPRLPHEPHDLPVDAVITEDGFTRLGAGSVS